MRAILITIDNVLQEVTLPEKAKALPVMADWVGGGYIEMVNIGREGLCMIVNEDGLMKGLRQNKYASLLYGGNIVGNVLLVNTTAEEFISLKPEWTIERIMNVIQALL